MTAYKYFTKDELIEAARAGNERGYNRQLDPDKLQDLEFVNFLPITLTLPHEHIAGELVEPHIRAMVQIGPDESVMLDMSTERYNELPEHNPDVLASISGDGPEDGQRRQHTSKKGR